jgi:uncharacterized membrane protein (DUF4010 family)
MDAFGLSSTSLFPLFVTLALSFMIGLEREEQATSTYTGFGGVRTFPIIGVCGFLFAKIAEGQAIVFAAGTLVVGSFLFLSYRKKLDSSVASGMTSEVSGLFTFLMGAIIYSGAIWEATLLAVVILLLLELKVTLEKLARKIAPVEIFTFTRFLLISAVILPIIPNREYTDLHLNPFHTWLIVVAISGLSYIAYLIGKFLNSGKSVLVAAVLGGLYSSTATTVVLAKRSKEEPASYTFSGAMVVATGLMYFRMVALVCLFNWDLGKLIALPFLGLGALACSFGWYWSTREPVHEAVLNAKLPQSNPLELKSALLFALIFTAMGALTLFARVYFGQAGIYGLAFLTGLSDVDPFVMNLTQSAGKEVLPHIACVGIVIAIASNNLIKGVYAWVGSSAAVKRQAPLLLIAFGLLSLIVLFLV